MPMQEVRSRKRQEVLLTDVTQYGHIVEVKKRPGKHNKTARK